MDEIMIKPALHSAVGGLTLLTALVATALNWTALRKGSPGQGASHASLILLQLLLLAQAAVGIKLLDQDMGVIQKYVHYLGGLGALALLLLPAWLPARLRRPALPAWTATASLLFIVMTFFIGQLYVRSLQNG